MSKARLVRAGIKGLRKAYKLGKKTKMASKNAKAGKKLASIAKKQKLKSTTAFVRQTGRSAAMRGTFSKTQRLKNAKNRSIIMKGDAGSRRLMKQATKNKAGQKAVNKVKGVNKIALKAGQNSRKLKAGAALSGGAVAASKGKYKMTAKHKAAISRGLKRRK